MEFKFLKMNKKSLFLLSTLILILSFLTNSFSHTYDHVYVKLADGTGYYKIKYLYFENYFLITCLILSIIIFYIAFLYSIFKEKIYPNWFIIIPIVNILCFIWFYSQGIANMAPNYFYYYDFYLGSSLFNIFILNILSFIIIFSIIFLVNKFKKVKELV